MSNSAVTCISGHHAASNFGHPLQGHAGATQKTGHVIFFLTSNFEHAQNLRFKRMELPLIPACHLCTTQEMRGHHKTSKKTLCGELIDFLQPVVSSNDVAVTQASRSWQEANWWAPCGTCGICAEGSHQPHNQSILTNGVCMVAGWWPPKHLYTLKINDIILGTLVAMTSPAPPSNLPNQLKQWIKHLNITY